MSDTHTVEHSAESHSALAHHFDNMEQQREAGTLGMWVFLVTEIMFFGGLFLAYILYRYTYAAEFAAASKELDWILGGINTAILICSSLTMALAVYYAQLGTRRLQVVFLILTMILGAAFLVIKGVEYKHKFEHHLFPGVGFKWEGDSSRYHEGEGGQFQGDEAAGLGQPGSAQPVEGEVQPFANAPGRLDPYKLQMFFWIYFAMTGVHALHMIIGLGVLTVLVFMAKKGRFTSEYHSPVEISGLYWHFVDIVWIFLFPLLYLIGRH